jgi:hypothetical protein
MKRGLVPAKYNLCSLCCLLFKIFSVHPLYEKADKLSSQVIGAAIEVPSGQRARADRIDLRAMPSARTGTAFDSGNNTKTGSRGV